MSIELPFEFINDTPADADEVNANFDTLVDAINSHFEESNPHGITPEIIGAALAVHTHTWEQIQDTPESFPPSAHKHSWSDVEDVPLASLTTAGIVKLTSDRNSNSEELALTAKAMDDHVKSGDHDGRYYTKDDVDSLLWESFRLGWMVPGDVTLATVTSSSGSEWETAGNWSGVVSFTVDRPGRYAIFGYIRARSSDTPGQLAICIPGWTSNRLILGNVELAGEPPPGLGWASVAFQTYSTDSAVSFYLDMRVPAATGGAVILVARESYVSEVSLKGVTGQPTPTMAWSRRS